MSIDPADILTLSDVAEQTGVSFNKLRSWHHRRKLPYIRRVGPALFDRDAVIPVVEALEEESKRYGQPSEPDPVS